MANTSDPSQPKQEQAGTGTVDPFRQQPAPPDPSQTVEEKMRRGRADAPVAQGEVSNRLDQFYAGAESGGGQEPAAPDR